MPGKHHNKHRGDADGEPRATSPAPASESSAAELRAQMAVLAEQVRRLGNRVGAPDDVWTAAVAQPVVAPTPSGGAAAPPSGPPVASASPSHVDDPASTPSPAHLVSPPSVHARSAGVAHPGLADVAPAAASPAVEATHHDEPIAELTGRLIATVIAMAERAAEQIRERAEREAARIRAQSRADQAAADHPTPDLAAPLARGPDLASSRTGVDALERQRLTLAALAAETDRIEAAAASLRAQVRALDAERQRLHEAIDAARRPPTRTDQPA